MLAGVPPKIVVYDQQGEVKREEGFNVNATDLEQRVAAAEAQRHHEERAGTLVRK